MSACVKLQVVLLVYLVQSYSVKSEHVLNCTSQQTGTDCIHSKGCSDESQHVRPEDCDPNYAASLFQIPRMLDKQLEECYNNGYSCEIASPEQSTKYEGKPQVSATFETVSINRYEMTVSWTHSPSNRSRVKGYQVDLMYGPAPTQLETFSCFCVEGSDVRSLLIKGLPEMNFQDDHKQLNVRVRPYPLPSHIRESDLDEITGENCSLWSDCPERYPGDCGTCRTYPYSCLDFGPHNCQPPKSPPPSNITLHTLIYNTANNQEAMQLDVHWYPPVTQQLGWHFHPRNYSYYIQLRYVDPVTGIRESVYFKASGSSSLFAVRLFPLNTSIHMYNYSVRLLTHYPCSGLATSIDDIGCGEPSNWFDLPPPSLLMPSSVSTFNPTATVHASDQLTPSFTSSSTQTATATPASTPAIQDSVLAIALPTVTVIALLVITVTIIIMLVFSRSTSRCKKTIDGWSGETFPPVRPPSPPPFPPPMLPPPAKVWNVLVMYSPDSNRDEISSILCYVVQGLRQSKCIEVNYPHQFVREGVVEVIEEKVKQAEAVFIVCNEQFKEDWETKQSQHINALRELIFSKVGNRRHELEKFAVVVLNNNYHFIPSDYLANLSKFNVGEIGEDQTDLMIHFVTNTSPYELAPIPSGRTSPQSVMTMCLCSPEHSNPSPEHSNPSRSFTKTLSSSEDISSVDQLPTHTCESSRTQEYTETPDVTIC